MAIILKNVPKTEEGRKLNLSKEDDEKYRLVFRINRESKEIDLYGIWNPKIVYDNSYVIVPLTSTYNGCQKMNIGEEVRNVKDSTGDKNPYGSWIGIIKLVYSVIGYNYDFGYCCLDDYKYSMANGTGTLLSHVNHSTGDTLGGHMIEKDKGTNVVAKGGDFLLLPICATHNNTSSDEYYFKVGQECMAVKMTGFKNLSSVVLNIVNSINADSDIEFDVRQYCDDNGVELQGMSFE